MKPDYKLVAKAKYIHTTADLASELDNRLNFLFFLKAYAEILNFCWCKWYWL